MVLLLLVLLLLDFYCAIQSKAEEFFSRTSSSVMELFLVVFPDHDNSVSRIPKPLLLVLLPTEAQKRRTSAAGTVGGIMMKSVDRNGWKIKIVAWSRDLCEKTGNDSNASTNTSRAATKKRLKNVEGFL